MFKNFTRFLYLWRDFFVEIDGVGNPLDEDACHGLLRRQLYQIRPRSIAIKHWYMLGTQVVAWCGADFQSRSTASLTKN